MCEGKERSDEQMGASEARVRRVATSRKGSPRIPKLIWRGAQRRAKGSCLKERYTICGEERSDELKVLVLKREIKYAAVASLQPSPRCRS